LYICIVKQRRGVFPEQLKENQNGNNNLQRFIYTTKEINRNFRIKINCIVDGKKVNKLVGVKGLIELIGVEIANKMLRRSFNGTDDKTVCKLRRGIKISFYVK
jgi:hypothetical protein